MDKDYLEKFKEPMDEAAYRKLWLSEWVPDPREEALYYRLKQYYDATPDAMGNSADVLEWRLFKDWAQAHGYTQAEINVAKRQCHEMGHI